MSGYRQGRDVEYAVIHHLAAEGYETQRAASSKGVADVIAIKPGQVLLVSVKRTSMPPPAERAELLRVSRMLPGLVPLVAIGRPALTFRRLTGLAAKDWEPWTADFAGGDRCDECGADWDGATPIQRESIEDALENDRCGLCLSVDHFRENCPDKETNR